MSVGAGDGVLPRGATIDVGGHEIKISGLLSDAGATGRVYEGWRESERGADGVQVAVKVMRGGQFGDDVTRFKQERGTLNTLGAAAEIAASEFDFAWRVVPHYYGMGSYNGVELFAMEYVAGDAVPELVAQQGRLDELQALRIAWQLFFVLDIMHVKQKQTYIDLKFENLRWVAGEDGAAGQLKLLDFGTLEKITDDPRHRGVNRDLLLGGCYLCAMLTGEMPDYSAAGLLKPAEPLIRMGAMTSGVRHLLSRMLHRNPAVRLATANEIFHELWVLVNYWDLPVVDVLASARRDLAAAENNAGEAADQVQAHARKARSALDIVMQRAPEQAPLLADENSQVEQLLAASDYLGRGKALFDGRAYFDAQRQFDMGRDWGAEPAMFRRWSYLALAGQKIDLELFLLHCADAVKVVEYLNNGQFTAARQRLELLKPMAAAAGIRALAADLELFEQLAVAEGLAGKNFEGAGQSFRKARAALLSLPDSAAVQREVGDLNLRVEEMDELLATVGRAPQLMADAQAALLLFDTGLAVEKAGAAFLAYGRDPGRITELLKLVDAALGQLDYASARQLAAIGYLKTDSARDSALLQRHLNFAGRLAMAVPQVNGEYPFYVAQMVRVALAAFPEHAVAVRAAKDLRDKAFVAVADTGNWVLMEELANLSEELGDAAWAADKRNSARTLQAEAKARAEKGIDRLLGEAQAWLLLVELDMAGMRRLVSEWSVEELRVALQEPAKPLRAARRAIEDARIIAPESNYRRQELDDLQARIDRAEFVPVTAEQAEVNTMETAALSRLAQQLEQLRKRTALSPDAQPPDAAPAQLGEYAARFFIACRQTALFSESAAERVASMRTLASGMLDRFGLKSWEAVRKAAGGNIERLMREFAAAQDAFQRGDLQQAELEVQRLEVEFDQTEEWRDLRSKVGMARVWVQWENNKILPPKSGRLEPALLKEIRSQLGYKLPAPYYKKILVILQAEAVAAQKGVKGALGERNQAAQFENLRLWVDVKLTIRQIEGDGHAGASGAHARVPTRPAV